MESANSLSERRFRKVILTLRLVGITLNMSSVSRVRAVYNGIVVACFYTTYSACLMDLILSESNLGGKMKTFREILGMQFVVLMHTFFRYLSFPWPKLCFLNYENCCVVLYNIKINYNVFVQKLNWISFRVVYIQKQKPHGVRGLKSVIRIFQSHSQIRNKFDTQTI
jgi:hypothetical protein